MSWLTDHISNFIQTEGVTIYRQDFNFDPAPYWKAMDAPDRVGIAEMKHIEGLYAFWDALLARNPGLLIDNCASGGRRIDLETIGRSIPLWRTDYQYFEPNGYQCHTYGLHLFLPCSGTGNNDPQKYFFRSSMNGAVVIGWEINGSSTRVLQHRPGPRGRRGIPGAPAVFLRRFLSPDGVFDFGRRLGGVPMGPAGRARRDRPGLPPAAGREASIGVRLHGLDADGGLRSLFEDYGIP